MKTVKTRAWKYLTFLIFSVALLYFLNGWMIGGRVVRTLEASSQTFFFVDRETGATDGFVTAIYSGPNWLGPTALNLRAVTANPIERITTTRRGNIIEVVIKGRNETNLGQKIQCGNDSLEFKFVNNN